MRSAASGTASLVPCAPAAAAAAAEAAEAKSPSATDICALSSFAQRCCPLAGLRLVSFRQRASAPVSPSAREEAPDSTELSENGSQKLWQSEGSTSLAARGRGRARADVQHNRTEGARHCVAAFRASLLGRDDGAGSDGGDRE